MSKVQTLRVFVNQRLSLAAEEIFDLFERTIAEYEEQLCRQNKLLDAVYNKQVGLNRKDVQQQTVSEEVPSERQEWTSSPDQEEPGPELPHIKEEQEELWTNQEEAEISKFTFDPVPVKIKEEDKETPQTSELQQEQTDQKGTNERDEEDCGEPEPVRNLTTDGHLHPVTRVRTLQYSEPETDDSYDWEETREPQSDLNLLQNNELSVSDGNCHTGLTPFSSYECAVNFGHDGLLQNQNEIQTGPFSCSICGKSYPRKNSLGAHMRLHFEGKRFSCPVCRKTFQWRRDVVTHMRSHTGEKPFSCMICGIRFARKEHLNRHAKVHTGEKPFSCSVCGKRFARNAHLRRHLAVHGGETISFQHL